MIFLTNNDKNQVKDHQDQLAHILTINSRSIKKKRNLFHKVIEEERPQVML